MKTYQQFLAQLKKAVFLQKKNCNQFKAKYYEFRQRSKIKSLTTNIRQT